MKKFLKSHLFLFAEAIILGIAVVSLVRVGIQENRIAAEIASLRKQVAREQQENAKLQSQLKSSASGSFWELEAKRALNYKKPEETVFVFYSAPQVKRDARISENNVAPKQWTSNPARWWHYFFH